MASILSNVAALGAARSLQTSGLGLNQAIERLTTGRRINRASDDAAGLGISNRLGADIRITQQARRNAFDGISYLQVADGILDEVTQALTRASELAEQARTGTVNAQGRDSLNIEYQQLGLSIQAMLTQSTFNGAPVFQNAPGTTTTTLSTADSYITQQVSAWTAASFENGADVLYKVFTDLVPGRAFGGSPAADDAELELGLAVSSLASTNPLQKASGLQSLQDAHDAILSLEATYPEDLDLRAIKTMSEYLLSHLPTSGTDIANAQAVIQAAATGSLTLTTTTEAADSVSSISVGAYSPVTLDTRSADIPTNLGSIATVAGAQSARSLLENGLEAVSSLRGKLGASMQQLGALSNALGIQAENFTGAYSQIRDADLAQEVIHLTRFQVLTQSGSNALNQAQQAQRQMLALLSN